MAENIRGDIITEAGRDVKFGAKTSEDCPSCNPTGSKDRKLFIRSNIENSVTLECPNCAYNVHKPVSDVPEAQGHIRDILGRPVR